MLHLLPHERVRNVKNMVQRKLKVPWRHQRLLHGNTPLADNHAIAAYDVQRNSTITRALYLRVGGPGDGTTGVRASCCWALDLEAGTLCPAVLSHRAQTSAPAARWTARCNTSAHDNICDIHELQAALPQPSKCTQTAESLQSTMRARILQSKADVRARHRGKPPTPGAAQPTPPVELETAHAPAANAVMRTVLKGLALGAPRLLVDVAVMGDTPANIGHHNHDVGHAVTTTTRGTGTGANGAATHGTGRTRTHQFFVRADAGHIITICVQTWDALVRDIQVHVHNKLRARAQRHRLVLAGKQPTRGECTVAEYGIGEGSTLDFLGRLCGRMPAKGDVTNGDATMTPAEGGPSVAAASNSSLLAWAKWVRGPYQAPLNSAHFEQQLHKWELASLEALTKQEVPEGAVAAMTTRAGLALTTEEATHAMAAYKGRRHLQPDFIAGVFHRVPSRITDESAIAQGQGAVPTQPHPTVLK